MPIDAKKVDQKLLEYVLERQRTAIETYRISVDLLEEHVGIEDNFRLGGYGTRQILELIQNAADALTHAGVPGRIELRLTGGALYCANEGAGFDEKGIRAVCFAFLSSKREEEQIGRFGLGFKSVLGVTENPKVITDGIGFEFNGPETSVLFEGLSTPSGRVPTLRVPSVLDVESEFDDDPNLRELASWATTIIKLPLSREGARLRQELSDLKTQSLLFLESVTRIDVSLGGADGSLVTRSHVRSAASPGSITLIAPDQRATEWAFASRSYRPSPEVSASLPDTMRRESMTVSYAVMLGEARDLGELWAWFPLEDKTTARGIFNAPWQVTDERTNLLPGSKLNREMLAVCADLFLDVVLRASTPADPAAHLDLFPARGDEARSNADAILSELIPARARERAVVPDADGVLRNIGYFERFPELNTPTIPPQLQAKWQSIVPRRNVPHPSCAANPRTRTTRLRILFRGQAEDGNRSRPEVRPESWLAELANARTIESVRSALEIHAELTRELFTPHKLQAAIIPIEGNRWMSTGTPARVLLPREGEPTPEGVTLVDPEFAADSRIRELLVAIGVREVSTDQTVVALAESARSTWAPDDWKNLWQKLVVASAPKAVAALERIRERGLRVQVLNRDGHWRDAREVLADDAFAPSLTTRHADPNLHRHRADLLAAAGCLVEPDPEYPISVEEVFADYRAEVEGRFEKELAKAGLTASGPAITDMTGSGPLDLLLELKNDLGALATWTRKLITTAASRTTPVSAPIRGRREKATLDVQSAEWWTINRFGLLTTSTGYAPVRIVCGAALAAYNDYLPVVSSDISLHLSSAPRTLAEVPDATLKVFLGRQRYHVTESARFTEVLVESARRQSIAAPEVIPCVVGEEVVLMAPQKVVILEDAADLELFEDHQLAWVDGSVEGVEILVERWGLLMSSDALSMSVEVRERTESIPLLELHPSLAASSRRPLASISVSRSPSIVRRTSSPNGDRPTRLWATLDEDVVVVDDSLDELRALVEISRVLRLGLDEASAAAVIAADEKVRSNELIKRSAAASDDAQRLLVLVGADVLKEKLPQGFLGVIESRLGKRSDRQIAELYLTVRGFEALYFIRNELRAQIPHTPTRWNGELNALAFVQDLGFDQVYAGTRDAPRPDVTQVQGYVHLPALHDFQEELVRKIRDVATLPGDTGEEARRGLLYLPTGAGKTRVSVEAICRMLRDGDISGPVVWIAQSEELCEQALQTWSEVWRAIGDERLLDLCRFWGGHGLEESLEELQVVIAIDDKLASGIKGANASNYEWLRREAALIVVDEAHTAGSPTYTAILEWFGLTARATPRPLLGLTATPYRGRNEYVNDLFAKRFRNNLLESLDANDPIGQLRSQGILAGVEHEIIEGGRFVATASEVDDYARMREVSKTLLDRVGQDLSRNQTVVDHVMALIRRTEESVKAGEADDSWPILIFAASVESAHTIAALLMVEGISAAAVDGSIRKKERRRVVESFKRGDIQVLVNCDLLTQGFDAPKVRALYIARPTYSPNRYHQMIGRGLRGTKNGGKSTCLIVNVRDTFEQFGEKLAYTEFDYLWK